jgi:ribonuclease HI
MLFIDGSVNNQSKIGFGAYLFVSEGTISSEELKHQIQVKRFLSTSSTKLEIQTLLWALSEIPVKERLTIYTDSQNIVGLTDRKEKLISNDFKSKNDKLINNHDLYKAFYTAIEHLECEFIKVQGHQVSSEKNDIDRLFTLVDRAARSAMRNS